MQMGGGIIIRRTAGRAGHCAKHITGTSSFRVQRQIAHILRYRICIAIFAKKTKTEITIRHSCLSNTGLLLLHFLYDL